DEKGDCPDRECIHFLLSFRVFFMEKWVSKVTMVPMEEAMRMGIITTEGRAEPVWERTAMMVEGTKEMPPRIKARYTAISSETSPGVALAFSNSCIALIPSGVAA